MKSSVMRIGSRNDVVYLKYKIMDNCKYYIRHAVSTRHGGVSAGDDVATLNLGFNTKDSAENVTENYIRFCKATGFNPNNLVFASQTHSDNVMYVTEEDCGKGIFRKKTYTDVDALITDRPRVALVIHTADCVPISFVDTKNIAIGNAHCGHRGTYAELAKKTLDAMKNKFGTNPNDVICTIGPAICGSCYEVSKELYDNFKAKFGFEDAIYKVNDEYHLDLMLINKHILESLGVKSIAVSDLCTKCNKHDLYSHRGLGPNRGLMSTIIEIK